MGPPLHDALFAAAFAEPEQAGALLRLALPSALVRGIDWASLQPAPERLVDARLDTRRLDLLFTARCRDGRACLLLLLEHKSQADRNAVLQVFGYLLRLWERHRDHAPGEPLPLVVPVLVHHGEGPWTAPTTLAGLLDWEAAAAFAEPDVDLAFALIAMQPSFQLLVLDLTRQPEAALLAQPLPLRARLTLLHLQHLRNRPAMEAEAALQRWHDLFRAAYAAPDGSQWLLSLHSYTLHVTDLPAARLQQVLAQILPVDQAMKIVSTAEKLRAEGHAQGHAQGRAEGQAEALLRLLARRFGPVPDAVVQRVRAAAPGDVDRWLDRVLDAKSIEELLA